MATFEIVGPDGNKYRVEGDDPAQAARAVSKVLRGPPSQEEAETLAKSEAEAMAADPLRPPRADAPGVSTGPRPDRFGDTIAAATEGPRAMTGAYLQGLQDPSQSISREALPDWIPGPVRSGVGYLNDAAGVAVGAALTGATAVPGLIGETFGGSPTREKQLARDVMMMGDTFAGMPGTSTVARPFVNLADDVARPAPRIPAGVGAAAGVVDDAESVRIGKLIGQAASGNAKARAALAKLAKVNKQAKDAADRLGIDLPADVFSDDVLLQSAAGLTRSEPASASEAAWINTIRAASDKADDVIARLGASKDVSSVSDDVLSNLTGTQTGLETRAGRLYDAVDAAVKKPTRIGTPSLNKALTETIQNVGEEGLTGAERALLKAASADGGITYGRLIREKQAIGRAIRRGDGPYGDVQVADLKRLYAALADDQMTAARLIGGESVAGKLELANKITQQQKDLEKAIVSAFGKDLEGSIARRLETAVTGASKGDVAALNRVINVVPEELRGEAVLTAIMSATKSKSVSSSLPQGAFGFAEYAKFWGSLRQNEAAYRAVTKTLPPEVKRVLNDLYVVSGRITNARGKVISTGRANKALLEGMTADNVLAKILESSVGKRTTEAVGFATGGPMGAVGARATTKMLTDAQKKTLRAAGALFRDPEFVKLMAQGGDDAQATADALASLPAFRRWYIAAERAGANNVNSPTGATVIRMFAAPDVAANERTEPGLVNVR